MARTVPEWRGKTDDTPPSSACKQRIVARQDRCCAMTGKPFSAKEKPQFDHKVPLWLGGKNCESNLHAIIREAHQAKTSAEAKVRAKVNAQQSADLGLTNKPKSKLAAAPKQPKQSRHAPLGPRSLFAPKEASIT